MYECFNVYMCCVCENCDKFLPPTEERRLANALREKKRHIQHLEELIDIVQKQLITWKPKEELEAELEAVYKILDDIENDKISVGEAILLEHKAIQKKE